MTVRFDKYQVGDKVYVYTDEPDNPADNTMRRSWFLDDKKVKSLGPFTVKSIYNLQPEAYEFSNHTQWLRFEEMPVSREYSGWWFKPVR